MATPSSLADELVSSTLAAELGGLPPDELMTPEDEPEEPYDYLEDFWLAKPYYSDEFAAEAIERFVRHSESATEGALGRTIWAAYRQYHNLSGVDGDPITQLQETGEVGELLAMSIPHYRSLVRHQIALFTAERPSWDPQARTSDSEGARQVPMASNLLDFVGASDALDTRLQEQVELMMVTGSGFFVTDWNPNVGRPPRGWFTQRVYAPWELVHEHVRCYEDASWWIWRAFENRWDWVARFAETDPEKAEKIAKLDTDKGDFATAFRDAQSQVEDDGDRLAVLYIIGKPTIACPEGRYAIVAAEDLVLYDGPYPYGDDITISRMCASEFLGTSIPFADSWGVLAAAEASNAILSMIVTRVDTNGVPNFCITEGTEIEFSEIAGANNVWKVPPGTEKPIAVDLLNIPDALPGIMKMLSSEMEQTVGINSVTRGQPAENVSSGSMAALLQSMAQQFNSNLERAWITNLERIGTHHIRIFQRMATEEHAISVVGADHKWTVQEFKGESIDKILRVSVKTASALSKTTAGRAEIADKLLERSAISPQEYLRVIQTGQLEPLFHGPVGELTSIKSRSEALLRGEEAPAIVWDNHQLCIREFKKLLNTDARKDMAIVEKIHKTIQQHFDEWSRLSRESPDMLAAIGCPPLPQAAQTGQQAQQLEQAGKMGGPPPGMPPGAVGAPPQQQKQPETDAPRGRPGPSPTPAGQQPSRTNPKQPTMPKPSVNPMDGKPVV